jgi:hypothetical protein
MTDDFTLRDFDPNNKVWADAIATLIAALAEVKVREDRRGVVLEKIANQLHSINQLLRESLPSGASVIATLAEVKYAALAEVKTRDDRNGVLLEKIGNQLQSISQLLEELLMGRSQG